MFSVDVAGGRGGLCGAVAVPVQSVKAASPPASNVEGDFRGYPAPMGKSVNAFLFSLDTLWHLSLGHLWFWTLTFVTAQEDAVGAAAWSDFQDAACKSILKGVRGVRVFQLHRSHGIHVHFVCDKRLAFWRVAKLAGRFGFGKIDVAKVRPVRSGGVWRLPGYLARDMGKACREKRRWLGRRRLWGAFGPWRNERTRVSDVKVEGDAVRLAREGGLTHRLDTYGWAQLAGFSMFGDSVHDFPPVIAVRYGAWIVALARRPDRLARERQRSGAASSSCCSLNNSENPF